MEKEPIPREEEPREETEESVEEEITEEDELTEMGFLDEDIEEIKRQREEVLAEIERLFNDMERAPLADRVLKELAMKIAVYRKIDLQEEFPESILGLYIGEVGRSTRE